MEEESTWGEVVAVRIITEAWPYCVQERYGTLIRTRRYWTRYGATYAYTRALDNAYTVARGVTLEPVRA